MAKFTNAIKATIKGWFNSGDQPTETQFANWIDYIQDGLDEHDHVGVVAGDGMATLGSTAGPLRLTVANTGLHILDTADNHDLIIVPGTNLSVDRTLTLTTGDFHRIITLQGNPTLNDWFDQSVKAAAEPTFNKIDVIDDIELNSVRIFDSVGTFQYVGQFAAATWTTVYTGVLGGSGLYLIWTDIFEPHSHGGVAWSVRMFWMMVLYASTADTDAVECPCHYAAHDLSGATFESRLQLVAGGNPPQIQVKTNQAITGSNITIDFNWLKIG